MTCAQKNKEKKVKKVNNLKECNKNELNFK